MKATMKGAVPRASVARTTVKPARRQTGLLAKAASKLKFARKECTDCRAETAFHAWHSAHLPASLNMFIDFADWGVLHAAGAIGKDDPHGGSPPAVDLVLY